MEESTQRLSEGNTAFNPLSGRREELTQPRTKVRGEGEISEQATPERNLVLASVEAGKMTNQVRAKG